MLQQRQADGRVDGQRGPLGGQRFQVAQAPELAPVGLREEHAGLGRVPPGVQGPELARGPEGQDVLGAGGARGGGGPAEA